MRVASPAITVSTDSIVPPPPPPLALPPLCLPACLSLCLSLCLFPSFSVSFFHSFPFPPVVSVSWHTLPRQASLVAGAPMIPMDTSPELREMSTFEESMSRLMADERVFSVDDDQRPSLDNYFTLDFRDTGGTMPPKRPCEQPSVLLTKLAA